MTRSDSVRYSRFCYSAGCRGNRYGTSAERLLRCQRHSQQPGYGHWQCDYWLCGESYRVFGAYSLVYQFRLFTVDMTQWWAWVVLFFADDFSYYWFHRISHSSRYFWASHVVHHSSMKYNLGTALRQTWTGNLTGAFIFWIWLPLVGFSPVAVMTMQAISLLYQFWIHTEHINKFPAPIEFIFNTPSHHRVHHGSDLDYLDKNHAGVLIIWDRLFGTFEPERARPTYGLTTNIHSHNPVRIAFHEWAAIGQDIRRAGSWRAAAGYIFGPPGWSHDGSRKTTKQLRTKQEPIAEPS